MICRSPLPILRSLVAGSHAGEEVVTLGDGVSAVSALPWACADAAIGMRRAPVAHARLAGQGVQVRMGLPSDADPGRCGFSGW